MRELYDYAESVGYRLPTINRYGAPIRFPAPNKPSSNKAAWVIVSESKLFAAFGDWGTGQKHYWHAEQRSVLPEDRASIDALIREEAIKRAIEEKKKHIKAMEIISVVLKYSKLVSSEHPYLIKKQVSLPSLSNNIYLGLQYMDMMQGIYNALIIPIYGIKDDFEGKVQSLQIIGKDGKKRFYKNSCTKGGYYPVNIPNDYNEIVICEGIATGRANTCRTLYPKCYGDLCF